MIIKNYKAPKHNPLFDVDKVIELLKKEEVEFDITRKSEMELCIKLKYPSDPDIGEIVISEIVNFPKGIDTRRIYSMWTYYCGYPDDSGDLTYYNIEELVKEILFM